MVSFKLTLSDREFLKGGFRRVSELLSELLHTFHSSFMLGVHLPIEVLPRLHFSSEPFQRRQFKPTVAAQPEPRPSQ